jgi:hypothetical protein
MSISSDDSHQCEQQDFDSPWTPRYEIRSTVSDNRPSFDVVDLKYNAAIVTHCQTRSEAKLECAILALEHLKKLRSKRPKSGVETKPNLRG